MRAPIFKAAQRIAEALHEHRSTSPECRESSRHRWGRRWSDQAMSRPEKVALALARRPQERSRFGPSGVQPLRALEYATILSAPIRAYCSSSTLPTTEVLRHPTRVIVGQAATVAAVRRQAESCDPRPIRTGWYPCDKMSCHHSRFSQYQRTVLANPNSKVSVARQFSSFSSFDASIAYRRS